MMALSIFCDGNKVLIYGRESINALRIIKPIDVFFVEGLKANLINISQIYGNNYIVKFTKNDCIMLHKGGNTVVRGIISNGNCYYVRAPLEIICNRLSLDNKELWH